MDIEDVRSHGVLLGGIGEEEKIAKVNNSKQR